MEFANENIYLPDRINLKNSKLPFDVSKKPNKKALADVGNVIHNHKSPIKQNIVIQKSKKPVSLENMDDEFFTCPCLSHAFELDDFSYDLPESLQLTKAEIDVFATRWSNLLPPEVDFDVSLEIVPVLDDFVSLYNKDEVDSSFMDVLNENLDYVPQIPEITDTE